MTEATTFEATFAVHGSDERFTQSRARGSRRSAVILQRDGNRADRLAFAQQVALRQLSSGDIFLYFSCELQGFIETQPERQSPRDRQPDLGLTRMSSSETVAAIQAM